MSDVTVGRSEVAQRVPEVVALVLGVSPAVARDAARDETPEWDSLKHVELMFTLEQAFDVEFSGPEMAAARSAEALVDVVCAARARAKGA